VPIVDTTCPVHRRRKSRFRQRGIGIGLFSQPLDTSHLALKSSHSRGGVVS
jgi:hypothetical protein